jgi:hypothetical protein
MKQKKPTRFDPEFSGLDRVGLLINESPGRGPDYSLFSRPMILNSAAPIYLLRHGRRMVRL